MDLLVRGADAFGIRLSRAQLGQFHRYYLEIVDWNSRVNLTSVTGRDEVQTRHFLDSLAVSAVLPQGLLRSGARVLDVGSGAGLPGLPLKIVFPSLRMTLAEATGKKTEFLTHVARKLGLDDVEVRTGRAETLAHDPELRESYDVVLSRGVARLAALAELTLPFCRPGGLAVAHKTAGIDEEVREARKAIETLGGGVREVRDIAFGSPNDSETFAGLATALVVLEKKGPTPDRYPRRPGVPTKRPL